MEPTRISVSDVKGRMERGESFVFLDARNPKAWGSSDVKLPGALRVPVDEVDQHLVQLPRDRTLVPYCT